MEIDKIASGNPSRPDVCNNGDQDEKLSRHVAFFVCLKKYINYRRKLLVLKTLLKKVTDESDGTIALLLQQAISFQNSLVAGGKARVNS